MPYSYKLPTTLQHNAPIVRFALSAQKEQTARREALSALRGDVQMQAHNARQLSEAEKRAEEREAEKKALTDTIAQQTAALQVDREALRQAAGLDADKAKLLSEQEKAQTRETALDAIEKLLNDCKTARSQFETAQNAYKQAQGRADEANAAYTQCSLLLRKPVRPPESGKRRFGCGNSRCSSSWPPVWRSPRSKPPRHS